MLGLASGAMAQLGVEGLFSTQLVLDLAAVAAGLVSGLELLVGVVDAVRCTLLPVLGGLGGLLALGLLFVHDLFFFLGAGDVETGCLSDDRRCDTRGGQAREEGCCCSCVVRRGLEADS